MKGELIGDVSPYFTGGGGMKGGGPLQFPC